MLFLYRNQNVDKQNILLLLSLLLINQPRSRCRSYRWPCFLSSFLPWYLRNFIYHSVVMFYSFICFFLLKQNQAPTTWANLSKADLIVILLSTCLDHFMILDQVLYFIFLCRSVQLFISRITLFNKNNSRLYGLEDNTQISAVCLHMCFHFIVF